MKFIIVGEQYIDNDRAPSFWVPDRHEVFSETSKKRATERFNSLLDKEWRKATLYALSVVAPVPFRPGRSAMSIAPRRARKRRA